MSRNTEYSFVEVNSDKIVTEMIARYEQITGHTVMPSDPERLFIAWAADLIIKEKMNQNYVGNQNIPSRAEGENLDALGQWIYNLTRSAARAAHCTVRFNISAVQTTAISVPKGTRVSDLSKTLVWETEEDSVIPIGNTYVDIDVVCQTAGTVGNGYTAGQICKLIDIDNILYYTSCANTNESDGGSDEEDDDTYFEMMRRSLDGYSTAGAQGSYIYHAKSVSDEISDVQAVCPVFVKTENLTVYTADNSKYAFIGGDNIKTGTLIVYPHGSSTAAVLNTDYTVAYNNSLCVISITAGGSLASQTVIDVSYKSDMAGHVYIYALMDDGTIATSTIKTAIGEACNKETVRPITDVVTVQDPQYADYNINLTYYVQRDTTKPLTEIQTELNAAVDVYKTWQCEKLGRDINPSKLEALLMATGIKRVVITAPTFTALQSGYSGVPQVARCGTVTLTNGGYEDE